MTFPAKARK